MSLKQAKESADLKNKIDNIQKQLSSKIDKSAIRFADGVMLDFENFFKVEGFKIEKHICKIVARYNSISAELSYENELCKYMGCFLVFDLVLSLKNTQKYSIQLIRNRDTFSSSANHEYISEENLQKTTNELNCFSDVGYWLLSMPDKSKPAPYRKTFHTMKDVLEHLINGDK